MDEVLTASAPMRALLRSTAPRQRQHMHPRAPSPDRRPRRRPFPPPPTTTITLRRRPFINRTRTGTTHPQRRGGSPRPRRLVALTAERGAPEASPPIGERACAPIHAATSRTSTPPMSDAQRSNADLGSVRDAARSSDWHKTSHKQPVNLGTRALHALPSCAFSAPIPIRR